jgi:hypothetical protein
MAIEIKQLIIKSTLVSENRSRDQMDSGRAQLGAADLRLLKQQLIEECKELVKQSLEEMQER